MKVLSSTKIRELASLCNFDDIGFSIPKILQKEYEHLKLWISKGYHAEMKYFENSLEKRTNPFLIMEDVKTIISLIICYYRHQSISNEKFRISLYAKSTDYHDVINQKLHDFTNLLKKEFPNIKTKAFCDTGPVMEKVWAQQAGIGWIGNNGCLITSKFGSFVFIATVFIDKYVDNYGTYKENSCNDCLICINSCPTKAIINKSIIDCRRCVSYLTIEHKSNFDSHTPNNFDNWIFGCDTCQNCCPFNKNLSYTNKIFSNNALPENIDWLNITEKEFNEIRKKTPLKRINYQRLQRNIHHVVNTNS